MILHLLLLLATTGFADKRGTSLAKCASYYLGLQLDKTSEDDEGEQVRTNFGQYLHCPETISETYKQYLVGDIVATFLLFEELKRHIERVREEIVLTKPFGFVSEEHLYQMWSEHGQLTHHIQLRAAIVLREATRNGLCVDLERLEPLRKELEAERDGLLKQLDSYGYRPGEGSQKALQRILQDIENNNPGIVFPRVPSGKISAAEDSLEPHTDVSPFISVYLRAAKIEKRLKTFLNKMAKGRLHSNFDILKTTGRTSSSGDISTQNIPRDPQIRSLFVPSPGHVFIIADYVAAELVTLAQAIQSQFGGHSVMAEKLNNGEDLHTLVASHLTGKSMDQITKEERQKAKAVNFGLPGGMGKMTLRQYARKNFGVELSEDEAKDSYDKWFDTFTEMSSFLNDNAENSGVAIANLLLITVAGFVQATGWRLSYASDIETLGKMARKVFGEKSPVSLSGRRYSESVCNYFWRRLETIADRLTEKQRKAVQNRVPSKELADTVMRLADPKGVLTLTGRLRSHTDYCARHNTIFQGLAADGENLAAWKLWRNGFRIVNFVHDEFLIELPKQDDPALYKELEEMVKRLMVEGMKEVVPDVNIKVESGIFDYWKKPD
jgi:DNA polymerase I-like protein with 3'-5' exonuclease and polymerase domains